MTEQLLSRSMHHAALSTETDVTMKGKFARLEEAMHAVDREAREELHRRQQKRQRLTGERKNANQEAFATAHGKTSSLKDELTAALPEGFQCRVRYVSTPPKRCDPLFSPPSAFEPETTRLGSHFLTVSTTPKADSGDEKTAGVLVFGIEVLIYSTKRLTTIFVSKADSTGYLPQQRPSPVKAITTRFLQWLFTKEQHEHPTRKLVISLFARAQSQYLFSGSAENSNKHVLDDRQLIKWWVRVLDPIFPKRDQHGISTEAADSEYDGYITVPGYEGMEIRSFLPPYNHSSGVGTHWNPGNPLPELAETRGIPKDTPPRCLLPRFPDDPKARFMQDLDDEIGISEDALATTSPSKGKDGKWNTIRDLGRFWEAMEFRQECSSGRVVGFIWLVICMKKSAQIQREQSEKESARFAARDASQGAQSNDPPSQPEEVPVVNDSPSKKRRKPLSGPIIPRQPRLKGGSSSLTATSDLSGMLNTEPGDGLVLTTEGYDKTMQTLLHLDFTNLKVATQSTSKWIADVSHICGIQTDWSLDIIGTAKPEELAKNASSSGDLQVNDLGGMIRKKRKADS